MQHRLSLRIPDTLYQLAKAEADRLGVSLNALLLFALDAYLRNNMPSSPSAPTPADNAPPRPIQAQVGIAPRQGKKRKKKKRR